MGEPRGGGQERYVPTRSADLRACGRLGGICSFLAQHRVCPVCPLVHWPDLQAVQLVSPAVAPNICRRGTGSSRNCDAPGPGVFWSGSRHPTPQQRAPAALLLPARAPVPAPAPELALASATHVCRALGARDLLGGGVSHGVEPSGADGHHTCGGGRLGGRTCAADRTRNRAASSAGLAGEARRARCTAALLLRREEAGRTW